MTKTKKVLPLDFACSKPLRQDSLGIRHSQSLKEKDLLSGRDLRCVTVVSTEVHLAEVNLVRRMNQIVYDVGIPSFCEWLAISSGLPTYRQCNTIINVHADILSITKIDTTSTTTCKTISRSNHT